MKPPEPDTAFEISLRPPAFSEFTVQIKVRERLELMVEAAKKRSGVLEHILLSGPSGLGKTTLAYIIANAMGVNVKNTSGPVIEKAGELAGLLTSREKGDVLFIDEIHRLKPTIEEYLYPAMEDYRLDIIIDKGPQARSLRLQLPKFTLFDDDAEPVIFHRRIKIFFDCRLEPMDLVDEKDVAFFQAGEQPRQLAGFFDDRPARVFNIHAHRVRDDVGEGGFAETGWAAQQNVFEDIAALFRRFHHQFQTLPHFHLTGELAEHRRPERNLESGVWFRRFHFGGIHFL